MLDACQKKFVINASIKQRKNPEDGKVLNSLGLVEGHSYSVLTVKDVGVDKICRIRNPWGKFEWQGDWSDKSSKWTDALKKQTGWVDADDGTFWMSWNDLIKYFNEIVINSYRNECELTSIMMCPKT